MAEQWIVRRTSQTARPTWPAKGKVYLATEHPTRKERNEHTAFVIEGYSNQQSGSEWGFHKNGFDILEHLP